ncbi:MAG: phosphatidylglycerol lysyltransferase domain-containing protein [Patescibacteria group bacterium]
MKKIAQFPQFEKLSTQHESLLRSLVSNYPSYSEFVFTSLFAWDTDDAVQVSCFDGGFAVLSQDHETKKKFYALIGSDNIDFLVRQLIELSNKKGFGGYLRLVPQTVIDNLNKASDLIIQEDRNNFDYILSANYHAELLGPKNENRRYLIRKFTKENGAGLTVQHLDLTNSQTRSDILECMSKWMLMSSKNSAKSEIEFIAIKRALDLSEQLPLQALGYYINGIMCAFSIFEYIQNSTGIVHFEKCNLNYKGIAQHVRNSVAKEFLANNVHYINYEQDLGVVGLRKAKSMLHPDSFLKKYTVSAKA